MKNKIKISGYFLRSSATTLLFPCVIVALCSAINLPSDPPKFSTLQNNTALSVDRHDSASSVASPTIRSNQTLTFADRVAYQRAIEEVYWRHRIWPKERPDPKPSLDAVMSQTQIESKVEDYLRNSQALEDDWKRPITAEQLQAEIDRMAQETKRPEVLSELFEALGNDSFVIAECLARPVLTNRLIADLSAQGKGTHFGSVQAEELRTKSVTTMLEGVAYTLPNISEGGTRCTEDTWTATSLSGAPDPRSFNTAMWTGSEMIIWGGADGPGIYGSGGRYDPSTDSWTATSNSNAPDARAGHTAVWTGSEMIVWGEVSPPA